MSVDVARNKNLLCQYVFGHYLDLEYKTTIQEYLSNTRWRDRFSVKNVDRVFYIHLQADVPWLSCLKTVGSMIISGHSYFFAMFVMKLDIDHRCWFGEIRISIDAELFLYCILKPDPRLCDVCISPGKIGHVFTLVKEFLHNDDDDDYRLVVSDREYSKRPLPLYFQCMEAVFRNALTTDILPPIVRHDVDKYNLLRSFNYNYISNN